MKIGLNEQSSQFKSLPSMKSDLRKNCVARFSGCRLTVSQSVSHSSVLIPRTTCGHTWYLSYLRFKVFTIRSKRILSYANFWRSTFHKVV